jgi:hypothetical protein
VAIKGASFIGLSVLELILAGSIVFIMIMFLGLRKRKRYGLILFYISAGGQFVEGFVQMFAGKGEFVRVVGGGLTAAVGFGLLMYFYNRRQYFNR